MMTTVSQAFSAIAKKPIKIYKYKLIGDCRSLDFNEALQFSNYLLSTYPKNFEIQVFKLHPTDWIFLCEKNTELDLDSPASRPGAIVINLEDDSKLTPQEWIDSIGKITKYSRPPPPSPDQCTDTWHAKLRTTLFPYAYFQFRKGDRLLPTVVIELRSDITPRLVEMFTLLCRGVVKGRNRLPLSYKGTTVFRIIDCVCFMCGDTAHCESEGRDGEVEVDTVFEHFRPAPDENFALSHDSEGVVALRGRGPDFQTGVFYITTAPVKWLDRKHCVIGRVVAGLEACRDIRDTPHNIWGVPKVPMSDWFSVFHISVVEDCGVIELD